MFVSKERAEYLAKLSYEVNKDNSVEDLITFKKAMEFDKKTADKIIEKYEEIIKIMNMEKEVASYGGRAVYIGNEIIEISNLQYVDSYEGRKNDGALTVIMEDKSKINITPYDKVYAPNIYSDSIFHSDEKGMPLLPSKRWWETYFQLIILEDRLIAPYMIRRGNLGGNILSFPMKETLNWIDFYSKEIDLINRLLDKCNGHIVVNSIATEEYLSLNIKATVLYLEDIGECDLANDIRCFDGDEVFLNYVIDNAMKGIYGAVLDRKDLIVSLL